MDRPQHDHWDLWSLHPVLSPIRAGYQTPEVNLVEAASTRYTISKVGYGIDAEPMESRGTKVTGTIKEIYIFRAYFSRP